jgi:hypothetical protein
MLEAIGLFTAETKKFVAMRKLTILPVSGKTLLSSGPNPLICLS